MTNWAASPSGKSQEEGKGVGRRKWLKNYWIFTPLGRWGKGILSTPPDNYFQEFETTFALEETPDQVKAIEDVLDDMISKRPMDRLICGDVGYGKTEVALRAAFKAVMDGKQVAMLVHATGAAASSFDSWPARAHPFRRIDRF